MASAGLGKLWWCAVAGVLLAACGGSATTGAGPGGTAGAGGGAPGAAGAAGTAGIAGKGCVVDGKSYADGERFPASDGCNSCTCEAGRASCTLVDCVEACEFNGQTYFPGQSFKVDCNTCTCEADGTVSCTEALCHSECLDLQAPYAVALKRAKACTNADQCTATVPDGLPCGCSTPVNASNTAAFNELKALTSQAALVCIASCAPCPPAPEQVTCTPAGSCELAPLRTGEAACKVDGIVYPSGSSGILKPGDCNTCTCEDGQLTACTERDCPAQICPKGTSPTTQCAKCGPTDGCEVVEYACLPNCTDSCAVGQCLNGVCRQICG